MSTYYWIRVDKSIQFESIPILRDTNKTFRIVKRTAFRCSTIAGLHLSISTIAVLHLVTGIQPLQDWI